MAGHAAVTGEDALRDKEPVDVVRRRLGPYEDDGCPVLGSLDRFVGVEDDPADGRPRRCGKTFRQNVVLGVRVDLRVQKLFDLLLKSLLHNKLKFNCLIKLVVKTILACI